MIQSVLVLALVGMLSVGLTSCGMNNDKTPGDPKLGGEYSLNDSGEPVQRSGTDIDQDQIGNADSYTNDNSNTQAKRSGKKTNVPRQRTAYDYLSDGRYRANRDGEVQDRDSLGKDLTQGARDMIKDAGKAMGDAGRRVTNAAKDTIRDFMD